MNYLSAPPVRKSLIDGNGKPVELPVEWVRFFTQLEELFNNLQRTGTTAQRPNPAPFVGFMHFDTTLGKPIWAKTSTTWVLADGTTA